MPHTLQKIAVVLGTSVLVACSATSSNSVQSTQKAVAESQPIIESAQQFPVASDGRLTLEKIMADPDWIGRQPEMLSGDMTVTLFIFAEKRRQHNS